jgi:hypothetical protein
MLMMMRRPEFLMIRRPEFLMMRRPELLMMRRPAPPQKSGSNGLYITTYPSLPVTEKHRGTNVVVVSRGSGVQ